MSIALYFGQMLSNYSNLFSKIPRRYKRTHEGEVKIPFKNGGQKNAFILNNISATCIV